MGALRKSQSDRDLGFHSVKRLSASPSVHQRGNRLCSTIWECEWRRPPLKEDGPNNPLAMYCSTWIGLKPCSRRPPLHPRYRGLRPLARPRGLLWERSACLRKSNCRWRSLGRRLSSSVPKEFADSIGNERALLFQCEVAGIKQVKLRFRQIGQIGLRAFHSEERIVLTPDD
jgi:hypothetical protein